MPEKVWHPGSDGRNYLFGHQRTPSMEFRDLTKQDAQSCLAAELDKLKKTIPDVQRAVVQKEFEGYQRLYSKFLADSGPSVVWESIEKPPEGSILNYLDLSLSGDTAGMKAMLDQLVVVKLNGTLGTPMGWSGVKAAIPVRNELTFLDLTVQQIQYLNNTYNVDVPLILMNSFNTDEEIEKIIRKYSGFNVSIRTFIQSRYPRINKESLMPIARSCRTEDDIEAWYPPGHGDFYESFNNSGLLDDLIQEGKKLCFLSNMDNLGGTVDLNILDFCFKKKHEFVMEVTDKTRADVTGGTLIQYDGKLRLLEAAQVPSQHVEDFSSVKTFNVFNTNNLWINLEATKRIVDLRSLEMEIIVNPRVLDGDINVVQLETAVGAAMKCFDNAVGLNVPRSRFLPVKKTSDLLLVMSNLYSLTRGALVMSSKRMFPSTPLVKLGDNYFKKVGGFLKRFGSIPDILELDHLTVSGDVTFGKGVVLKGTVIIIANHGDRIDIPDGSVLENRIVSGNLRILDH